MSNSQNLLNISNTTQDKTGNSCFRTQFRNHLKTIKIKESKTRTHNNSQNNQIISKSCKKDSSGNSLKITQLNWRISCIMHSSGDTQKQRISSTTIKNKVKNHITNTLTNTCTHESQILINTSHDLQHNLCTHGSQIPSGTSHDLH